MHRAGVLYLGHNVNRFMIVPPKSSQFNITSVCTAECTSQVDYIHVLISITIFSFSSYNVNWRASEASESLC